MEERYRRFFRSEDNLFAQDAPVIIRAGALLLDRWTNTIVAQLKFQNISQKKIKSIKVRLLPYDAEKRQLSNEFEFQYIDLQERRDSQFGSKLPLRFPDNAVRAFSARVVEVVFDDDTVWADKSLEWNTLPEQKPLSDALQDDLLQQYRILHGNDHSLRYVAEAFCGIWRCTCGAINRENETSCHSCRRTYFDLINTLDVDVLMQAQNERLEQEARQAEEARLRREEEQRRQEEERIRLANERLRQQEEKQRKQEERKAEKKNRRKNRRKTRRKRLLVLLLILVLLFVLILECSLLIRKNVISINSDRLTALFGQEHADETTIEVGNVFSFGHYEQDNDPENGEEPIEWIVLDVQDDRALLISRYALDAQPYNYERDRVTWETCSLRTWLNEDFVQAAFSQEEQDKIAVSTVSANDNPSYDTDAGNDTHDQLFLLDIGQADSYFLSETERQCQPTAYAQAQNPEVGSNGYCKWWLRTPGQITVTTGIVTTGGEIDTAGYGVTNILAIRPAMWVDASIIDASMIDMSVHETEESDIDEAYLELEPETIAFIREYGESLYERYQLIDDPNATFIMADKDGDIICLGNNQIEVGSSVYFGEYQHDDREEKGTEPIEWLVVDVQEDRALLISRYILDGPKFNETEDENITWANSSIRTWLNDTFMHTAFSNAECDVIASTSISEGQTQDQMFLLSIEEVRTYFPSDEERGCKPTRYGMVHGGVTDATGNCRWWLRTSGAEPNSVSYVCENGEINAEGVPATVYYHGTRPAMWIDLTALDVQ